MLTIPAQRPPPDRSVVTLVDVTSLREALLLARGAGWLVLGARLSPEGVELLLTR